MKKCSVFLPWRPSLADQNKALSLKINKVKTTPTQQLRNIYIEILAFPDGSGGKHLPAMQETWVQSLGWEDSPKRRKWHPTPVFLPRKLHGL